MWGNRKRMSSILSQPTSASQRALRRALQRVRKHHYIQVRSAEGSMATPAQVERLKPARSKGVTPRTGKTKAAAKQAA